MNHKCTAMFFFRRLWIFIETFCELREVLRRTWFIHINTSRAQLWWSVTPSAYREIEPIQREMSPPIYTVIFQSTIKEWIFILCMNLIEWRYIYKRFVWFINTDAKWFIIDVTDSRLLLLVFFLLKIFNQILLISVYQIVYYWLIASAGGFY